MNTLPRLDRLPWYDPPFVHPLARSLTRRGGFIGSIIDSAAFKECLASFPYERQTVTATRPASRRMPQYIPPELDLSWRWLCNPGVGPWYRKAAGGCWYADAYRFIEKATQKPADILSIRRAAAELAPFPSWVDLLVGEVVMRTIRAEESLMVL